MAFFNYHNDGTQYTIGGVYTCLTALFMGANLLEAVPLAVILPAVIMFLINAPKFLREALLLYREYKKPNSTTEIAADLGAGGEPDNAVQD